MEEILSIKSLVYNKIKYENIVILKNKVTFITGESGTGKTTLLKLFNQTISQSEGEISYKDKDISKYGTVALRQQILLVSQFVFLFDNSSIKGNFEKFYNFREKECISEDEMKKYLNICCVDFDLDKECTFMSGGERQRIYTAIFLSFMPEVIMLDEPTSALDNLTSKKFMKSISSFVKENNMTLIVVSHDDEIVKKYADNIITIGKGE